MKLNVKNEQGFTLVELMVVVAIIGVLSAVAIPNFKKYQAKAKTSEAKVQLAAAYTAQQSFYSDFGMFGNCLAYMGYDPHNEARSRYYAVGINQATTITAAVYTSAQNSGLSAAQCPQAQTVTQAPAIGTATVGSETVFRAGKQVGNAVATVNLDASVGSCISNQSTTNDPDQTHGTCQANAQEFVMGAQGTISTDKTTATTNSVFTMNESKVLVNLRSGY